MSCLWRLEPQPFRPLYMEHILVKCSDVVLCPWTSNLFILQSIFVSLVVDYWEVQSLAQCRGSHQHEGSCYSHDLAATAQQHPTRSGTFRRQGKFLSETRLLLDIVLTIFSFRRSQSWKMTLKFFALNTKGWVTRKQDFRVFHFYLPSMIAVSFCLYFYYRF